MSELTPWEDTPHSRGRPEGHTQSAHGKRTGARTQALAEELPALDVEWLLVSAPVDVRYLTGYTGSNGIAAVAARNGGGGEGEQLFVTDFRYATQSAQQVPDDYRREIVSGDLFEALAKLLEEQAGEGPRRLGFDESALSVKRWERLRELLSDRWELVQCGGVVGRAREVKEEREVERIRAATQLADDALTQTLAEGIVGRTEREVAIELELRMRRLGAQAASFPTIVACGAHGALPHAEPRAQEIPRGVLVTIDWGAYLDGYCSDCTRTYATGPLEQEAIDVYELVLAAQEAGLAALRAGLDGREVDAVAREVIERAGYGEHFGHGLGHGVGMEVHEEPRLSRTAREEPLRAGNVVTVEPGVYLPGRFGVRIEDLAVVGAYGHERLTTLPKQLTYLD